MSIRERDTMRGPDDHLVELCTLFCLSAWQVQVLRSDANGAVTGELGQDVVSLDGADPRSILPAVPLPLTGQVNGRSVNLLLHLAEDLRSSEWNVDHRPERL
jgi:hypothetical protein